MQHHPEEFSVTDFRHLLQEAWRIIRQRRWYFVFPFCVATSLACLASLWVPRQYSTKTVIKREQDPVFASLLGTNWTQPYTEMRKRILSDLQNEETIEQVVADLDLPAGLSRYPNGDLTPEGAAARGAYVAGIITNLTIQSMSADSNVDLVAIKLTLPDAENLPRVLAAIRDRYISNASRRTVEVLRDVKQFFETESDRCRTEMGVLQKALAEYEARYPSINPDFADPTRTEQTTLAVERLSLERKLDELKTRGERLAENLARISREAGSAPTTGGEPAVRMEPNPRYLELAAEIQRIQREVAEKKTLRGMTDAHPIIEQLRATMNLRRNEMKGIPREIEASSIDRSDKAAVEIPLEERLRRQLAENESEATAAQARLAAITDQVGEIERTRAQAVDHRQDYLKLRQQSDSLKSQLTTWQQNIDSIQNIFMAEERNRTVHFSTLRDVLPVERPSSPQAGVVLLICLGVGVACGVLAILGVELADRSYRTVKQLQSSLGLPVIEGIDEILTATVRRRRLVNSFVVMPLAATIGAAAVAFAGALAYVSIDNPGSYQQLRKLQWSQFFAEANHPRDVTVGLADWPEKAP